MKENAVVDFDLRKVYFQKIVESLKLGPAPQDWDLNWGEPFIAVTKNRQVWVRIFYEETQPPSLEKLKNEVARLIPLLPPQGQLSLCFPRTWEVDRGNLPVSDSFLIRYWNYSPFERNGSLSVQEMMDTPASVIPSSSLKKATMPEPFAVVDQRLNSDEVRELAEMGLALKRALLKG